ncbi:MAG TPA: hypothetical protein VEL05_05135, partial [Candidatus Acidoferrum sp.]|nr:hypothetical protein [Candidatus Acidoferrum sp.]
MPRPQSERDDERSGGERRAAEADVFTRTWHGKKAAACVAPQNARSGTCKKRRPPARETAEVARASAKATPAVAAVGPRSTTRPAIQ